MCGIVAGVSPRNVVPVLVEGLKRLEYRGYDSCGVAVIAEDGIRRARSVARVHELCEQLRMVLPGALVSPIPAGQRMAVPWVAMHIRILRGGV